MDLKKIISLVLSLIIIGIVVYNTHGRISKKRYKKIEINMLAGYISYWAFSVIVLFLFHFRLFLTIGYLGSLVFAYKYLQLQILRFHDLNHSGWYCLFERIPILNLYFLYVKFTKTRTLLINEFDENIDFLKFLKKNRLYPEKSFIALDGMDFFVNGVKFEYRKYNNQIQYEVSKMNLEENKLVEDYCKNNLEQVENAPSYAENYKISFLDEGNLLEKIRDDLHAIVAKDGFAIINGAEIFIRKNYGLYDIVYEKKFAPKIKVFSDVEDDGSYCCQTLSREELVYFIKNFV